MLQGFHHRLGHGDSRQAQILYNGQHLVGTESYDEVTENEYIGEICVILCNISDEPFEVKQGDRIAQAVLTKYSNIEWVTTTTLEQTDRGEGGFGSSGV